MRGLTKHLHLLVVLILIENVKITMPLKDDLTSFHWCFNKHGDFIIHPWDCSKFIRCSHNRAHVFQCPSKLRWNQAIQSCDWPETTKCVVLELSKGNVKFLKDNNVKKKIMKRDTSKQNTLNLLESVTESVASTELKSITPSRKSFYNLNGLARMPYNAGDISTTQSVLRSTSISTLATQKIAEKSPCSKKVTKNHDEVLNSAKNIEENVNITPLPPDYKMPYNDSQQVVDVKDSLLILSSTQINDDLIVQPTIPTTLKIIEDKASTTLTFEENTPTTTESITEIFITPSQYNNNMEFHIITEPANIGDPLLKPSTIINDNLGDQPTRDLKSTALKDIGSEASMNTNFVEKALTTREYVAEINTQKTFETQLNYELTDISKESITDLTENVTEDNSLKNIQTDNDENSSRVTNTIVTEQFVYIEQNKTKEKPQSDTTHVSSGGNGNNMATLNTEQPESSENGLTFLSTQTKHVTNLFNIIVEDETTFFTTVTTNTEQSTEAETAAAAGNLTALSIIKDNDNSTGMINKLNNETPFATPSALMETDKPVMFTETHQTFKEDLPVAASDVDNLTEATTYVNNLTEATTDVDNLTEATTDVDNLTEATTDVDNPTADVDNLTEAATDVDNLTKETTYVDNLTEAATDVDNITEATNDVDNLREATTYVNNLTEATTDVDNLTEATTVVDNLTEATKDVDNLTEAATYVNNLTEATTDVDNLTEATTVVDNLTVAATNVEIETETANFIRTTMNLKYYDNTNKLPTTTVSQLFEDANENFKTKTKMDYDLITDSPAMVQDTNVIKIASKDLTEVTSETWKYTDGETLETTTKISETELKTIAEIAIQTKSTVALVTETTSSMETDFTAALVIETTSAMETDSIEPATVTETTNNKENMLTTLVDNDLTNAEIKQNNFQEVSFIFTIPTTEHDYAINDTTSNSLATNENGSLTTNDNHEATQEHEITTIFPTTIEIITDISTTLMPENSSQAFNNDVNSNSDVLITAAKQDQPKTTLPSSYTSGQELKGSEYQNNNVSTSIVTPDPYDDIDGDLNNFFSNSSTTIDPRLPFRSPKCRGANNNRQLQASICSQYYQCFAGWAFLLNCHEGYQFVNKKGKCILDIKQECKQ